MTAKIMQSFAAGILVAASFMTVVYMFGPDRSSTSASSTSNSKVNLTTNEMKSELADDGYVVHTKEEWDAQIAAVEAAEKKASKAEKTAKKAEDAADKAAKEADEANKTNSDAKDQPEGEQTEKVEYRTVLFVASGMTSIDVGNALVQSKIIPNAFEFSQEVERRGLANALKPGMYEVQSGMTMDEIIGTIFK